MSSYWVPDEEAPENIPTLAGGPPTGSLPGQMKRPAPLAQSAEHIHGKDGVAGSIPAGGSTPNQQARPGLVPGLTHAEGYATYLALGPSSLRSRTSPSGYATTSCPCPPRDRRASTVLQARTPLAVREQGRHRKHVAGRGVKDTRTGDVGSDGRLLMKHVNAAHELAAGKALRQGAVRHPGANRVQV